MHPLERIRLAQVGEGKKKRRRWNWGKWDKVIKDLERGAGLKQRDLEQRHGGKFKSIKAC